VSAAAGRGENEQEAQNAAASDGTDGDDARAGQRVRGPLGVGNVDAARAACLEAARKEGARPIETYNVRSLGEGVTRCPWATGARSAPLRGIVKTCGSACLAPLVEHLLVDLGRRVV
jgi:hypothetical protein